MALTAIVVGLLLAGGLAVRLIGLTDPPLDSALGRQFHSAFLARALFVDSLPSAAEWQVEVAQAGAPRLIEPPILELASAAIYRIAGAEELWVPRLLSIGSWILAALALYALARRLGFRWGAAAAVAVMLFLPFTVQFSRNFQPEPLMVALMIAAAWAMVRYDDAPSRTGLALVIALTAATGFVKLVGLFVPFGVFAALMIHRLGWRAALRDRGAWLFAIVAALPALAWTAYGFLGAGFLVGQEDGRIVPELLVQPGHWLQTGRLIAQVATPPILVVAAIGLVVVPRGRPMAFAVGAGVGYLAFMLVFTYHTGTHDYYHLQLVPLLALGVASCVDRVARDRRLRPVVAVLSVLGIVVGAVIGVSRMVPSTQQLETIEVAEQVGRAVDHSTHTVSVVERPWPPRPAWYYGQFGGRTWFLAAELDSAAVTGAAVDAELLLKQALRRRDRYLVILDRSQVDDVPGLWPILRSRYPVVEETPAFVVFDLTRRRGAGG